MGRGHLPAAGRGQARKCLSTWGEARWSKSGVSREKGAGAAAGKQGRAGRAQCHERARRYLAGSMPGPGVCGAAGDSVTAEAAACAAAAAAPANEGCRCGCGGPSTDGRGLGRGCGGVTPGAGCSGIAASRSTSCSAEGRSEGRASKHSRMSSRTSTGHSSGTLQ
jgi:hypothetical protein